MAESKRRQKIAAGSAAAAGLAAFAGYMYKEYKKNFLVRGAEPTGFLEYYRERHPEMKTRDFSCPSDKKAQIRGLILLPEGEPQALIVMTHGYNFTLENYLPLGRRFTLAGFAVLLFDGVGCGRSEGMGIYGIPQHTLDMKSVLESVAEDPDLSSMPLLLFGHSWAGQAATTVACLGNFPIRGIISCSSSRTSMSAMNQSIHRRYGKAALLIEKISDGMVFCAFGKNAFLSMEDGLRKANCPAQVYHSRDDVIIDFEESFLAVKKALSDCPQIQFIEVDGRGHDVYLFPENSRRQREIRKELKKELEENHRKELLEELGQLMSETDEEKARQFIDFYKNCLRETGDGSLSPSEMP